MSVLSWNFYIKVKKFAKSGEGGEGEGGSRCSWRHYWLHHRWFWEDCWIVDVEWNDGGGSLECCLKEGRNKKNMGGWLVGDDEKVADIRVDGFDNDAGHYDLGRIHWLFGFVSVSKGFLPRCFQFHSHLGNPWGGLKTNFFPFQSFQFPVYSHFGFHLRPASQYWLVYYFSTSFWVLFLSLHLTCAHQFQLCSFFRRCVFFCLCQSFWLHCDLIGCCRLKRRDLW